MRQTHEVLRNGFKSDEWSDEEVQSEDSVTYLGFRVSYRFSSSKLSHLSQTETPDPICITKYNSGNLTFYPHPPLLSGSCPPTPVEEVTMVNNHILRLLRFLRDNLNWKMQ